MSTQLLAVLDDDTQACLADSVGKWMNSKGFQAPLPEWFVDANVPESFRSGHMPGITVDFTRSPVYRSG